LDIYNVDLVVVCANVPVAKTTVLRAVARDAKSRVKDLVDVVDEVRKSCSASYFTGTAAIVDIEQGNIPYVLATCGELFESARPLLMSSNVLGVTSTWPRVMRKTPFMHSLTALVFRTRMSETSQLRRKRATGPRT